MSEANSDLLPLVVYFVAVFALVGSVMVMSFFAGGRSKMEKARIEPYESGIVPVGDARTPISVEFYLVAMFFVIFDLETVFIFAWAVAFDELGWMGYIAVVVFVVVLVLALIYEWKSGALEWGVKRRKGLEN